jgi:hypothetical protein
LGGWRGRGLVLLWSVLGLRERREVRGEGSSSSSSSSVREWCWAADLGSEG